MSKRPTKIKSKTQFTEAYHLVQASVEAFARLSPNIPKVLLNVVQRIYGRFDEAAYCLYRAGNTFDRQEKLEFLNRAQIEIFYQFSSFELLVKSRGLTIGGANEVLSLLKRAHESTCKWLTSVKKEKALNDQRKGVTAAFTR